MYAPPCVWKNNIKEGDPHGSRDPVVAWGAVKNQPSAQGLVCCPVWRPLGSHLRASPRPCVCTTLCMHRLVCGQPNHPLLRLALLHAGAAPAPPLNNKILAVAIDRLVCALPCVRTTLCVDSQTTPCFGSLRWTPGQAPHPPLNNKTPVVAIDRLVCAPPCVCTALCVDSQTTPCFGSLP